MWNRGARHVQADASTAAAPRLQLWQRRNWHWYLKREHLWPPGTTVHLLWSECRGDTLHTVTSAAVHERFTLASTGSVSPWGTAAVIDGADVLLTPLQHGLVPPPMAAARLRCSASVAAVAWGQRHGCEVLAAVTAAGGLEIGTAVEEDLWEETAQEAHERADQPPARTQDLAPALLVRIPVNHAFPWSASQR